METFRLKMQDLRIPKVPPAMHLHTFLKTYSQSVQNGVYDVQTVCCDVDVV